MASYSALFAVHKTLTAATVDTVTLTESVGVVEIANRGTTDPLYVTVGGTPASSVADPTVGGDDTSWVPAGGVRTVRTAAVAAGVDLVVKLIAATGVAYSVQAGGQ